MIAFRGSASGVYGTFQPTSDCDKFNPFCITKRCSTVRTITNRFEFGLGLLPIHQGIKSVRYNFWVFLLVSGLIGASIWRGCVLSSRVGVAACRGSRAGEESGMPGRAGCVVFFREEPKNCVFSGKRACFMRHGCYNIIQKRPILTPVRLVAGRYRVDFAGLSALILALSEEVR